MQPVKRLELAAQQVDCSRYKVLGWQSSGCKETYDEKHLTCDVDCKQ